MTIRFYQPEDADRIAALEAATFADPWSTEAVREAVRYGTVFFIAEEKGVFLGYAGMKPVLDEGQVANVAVTEKARGQGIGKALMTALLAHAETLSLATVTLEVRPSNAAAIRLYTGLGFHEVGRRPHFYAHPDEDALIFTYEVK